MALLTGQPEASPQAIEANTLRRGIEVASENVGRPPVPERGVYVPGEVIQHASSVATNRAHAIYGPDAKRTFGGFGDHLKDDALVQFHLQRTSMGKGRKDHQPKPVSVTGSRLDGAHPPSTARRSLEPRGEFLQPRSLRRLGEDQDLRALSEQVALHAGPDGAATGSTAAPPNVALDDTATRSGRYCRLLAAHFDDREAKQQACESEACASWSEHPSRSERCVIEQDAAGEEGHREVGQRGQRNHSIAYKEAGRCTYEDEKEEDVDRLTEKTESAHAERSTPCCARGLPLGRGPTRGASFGNSKDDLKETMRTPLLLALPIIVAACGDEAMTTPMMPANPGAATTAAQLLEDCAGTFDVSEVDMPATMRVDGRRLIMRGVYVDNTSQELLRLLDANPEVRTLVLAHVGGSDVSNEGNLTGGREVRRRGLATCVPTGGLVASGGTDFLLAGAERAVFPNARAGVHAWAGDDGNGNAVQANQFPRDSMEHAGFLSYYRDIGISADFYWFTLDAAPPDGMYYMTRAEMMQFNVFTTE